MLLSPEELKKSSVMDPTIVEFMKNNPMPPIDWSNLEEVRGGMAVGEQLNLAQMGPANPDVLTETYRDIPLRDGTTSKIKIHTPTKPAEGGAPLFVLAFGGGFIGGSIEQMTIFARIIVKLYGAVVVNLNYRLAPEHPFPTSQLDGWDTLKWCADNAHELGADPTKGFIMGGVSAGGNVTTVCVTKSIEEPLKYPITGQYLGVPSTMDPEHTPEKYRKYHLALEHNPDAPILYSAGMDDIDGYTKCDKDSPLRYPVNSKAPLSKQPPAYFMADGLDPLRDDALIWEEMLKEAGVKTKLDFYPGCPHAHWAFMPGIEVSNKAVVNMIIGLGWLLGKEVSADEATKALI